jgi:ClpP class serine protease
MPTWSVILNEARKLGASNPNAAIDYIVNQKNTFLSRLSEKTGRNTILYFSSFLQKQPSNDASINDLDINAFMENIHGLDKSRGLDLILHTPGGDLAATEQIIKYLKSCFHGDIRAVIPQMAMSAGSMIAVSCKSVIMGKQSSLGPFDPQLNGVPCQSALREFYKAVEDVSKNPASLGLWQAILSKLNPTFLTLCAQADELAEELTEKILEDKEIKPQIKQRIKNTFAKNEESKTHSRHFDRDKCKEAGLDVIDLEADNELQDIVLSIHHCCMILAEQTPVVKIVENNIGGCYIRNANIPAPAHVP